MPTDIPKALTVSDIIAGEIRAIRRARDLTAQQLAERCAEVGFPDLTTQALSNIESGRRDGDGRRRRYITVEELLAIGCALNVAPLDLLVPQSAADPYAVTPAVAVEPSAVAEWAAGEWPLTGTTPKADIDLPTSGAMVEFTARMPSDRRDRVLRRWTNHGNGPSTARVTSGGDAFEIRDIALPLSALDDEAASK